MARAALLVPQVLASIRAIYTEAHTLSRALGIYGMMMGLAAAFEGKALPIRHIPGPEGVRGRNSDNALIREKLGWEPTTTLHELVKEMVLSDYSAAKRDSLVKLAGFQAYDHHE